MSEQQPKVARIGLNLEVRMEDVPALIELLGAYAIDRVRIGEQHMSFLEDMEKNQLRDVVSVHSIRTFYHNYFHDETPSPLATTLFNRIGTLIPEDAKTIDSKGRLQSVMRKAWDDTVADIFAGTSEIKLSKHTKSRRLLEDFQAYLPSSNDAQDL